MKSIARSLRPLRGWFIRKTRRPQIGKVNFGDLGRLEPVSRDWGFDRGTPLDRFYIERFLAEHSADIHGRVLEVANNAYTMKFGGDRVTRSDVLHPVPGNPRATLVVDLGTGVDVPENVFDCIICTQTLQLIFAVQHAIGSLHRMLKPAGVLLVTVPGISQISREDMVETGDYWRFTTASIRRLLKGPFGESVTVESAGNVHAATAFLHGVSVEELDANALEYKDPQFQMLLMGRAVKQG